MNKLLKSGIIGGLAGIPFVIIGILIFLFGARSVSPTSSPGLYTLVILSFLLVPTIGFLISGLISGILAHSHLKNAWESFLPGLIAGFTIICIPLVFLLILASLLSRSIPHLLYGDYPNGSGQTLILASLLVIEISLAGLCSALASLFMFFRKDFGRAELKTGKEPDVGSLDALYDELLSDARTMIADMNRSIAVYWIAGIFILVSGAVISGFAIAGWQHILSSGPGGFNSYDFFLAIAETICGLAQLIMGPFLLYWHNKLRKRYSRLTHLERASGD